MNNIESFFINAVLILFSMLIYEYFIVYRQNLKKEKINILLSVSLYISFYLAISIKSSKNFLCSSILLLFSKLFPKCQSAVCNILKNSPSKSFKYNCKFYHLYKYYTFSLSLI